MNRSTAELVEPLTEREREILALLAQGKSNGEIAEMLFLSVHTVKWYNRQLYNKLGVANRQHAAERAQALGLLETEPAGTVQAHRLPDYAIPLIGRDKEVGELMTLLQDGTRRVISVVGPGGVGKTRLAVEVAHSISDRFADGAAFVDLTAVSAPDGIVAAIAQAFSLSFEAFGTMGPKLQLLDYLREKALLLVLDNFEHLQEAAALLMEIVAAAPAVRVLVTSREVLRLQVEHLYPLAGLTHSSWKTVAQAEQDGAAALFLYHAHRVRPSFALQADDLEPLHALVQQVAGMPLALILAASWMEMLSVKEIAKEVGKSLDFLEAGYRDLPQRQQSMRAVFEVTWERLSEEEQAVFQALSVFRGGFTLQAAQEITGATPVHLRRLVQRQLAARDESGRFAIHELLRQFGAEKLADSVDEEAGVRERHSIYYCRFLHDRDAAYKGARHGEAAREIALEFENAVGAWNWAVEHNRIMRLREATVLGYYSAFEGRRIEAAALFQRAADRLAPNSPAEQRAYAYLLAGRVIFHSSLPGVRTSTALRKELLNEALQHLAAAREQGEDVRYEEGFVLAILGQELMDDDSLAAIATLERSLALLTEAGSTFNMAYVNKHLATAHVSIGSFACAQAYQSRAVKLWESAGATHFLNLHRMTLARINAYLGHYEQSVEDIRQLLVRFREAGHRTAWAEGELELGEVLLLCGQYEDAQKRFASAETLFASLGGSLSEGDARSYWCIASLHLGRLGEAWETSQKALDVFRQDQATYGIATIAGLHGCAALAADRPAEAVALLEQSLKIGRGVLLSESRGWFLASLACAALLSGEVAAAQQQAREALELARKSGIPVWAAMALASVALLVAKAGQAERALALYTLACREPYVGNSCWYAAVFGRRLEEVAGELPPETVAAARAGGATLDLWVAVEALMEELDGIDTNGHRQGGE